MATASVKGQPEVIAYGGAVEDYYTFTDAEAISEGDFIRITSGGTIKLAEVNRDSIAGALHGIALEDGTTAGVAIKVLLFADDTYVRVPCVDTVAPEDLTAGVAYDLEDGTNVWGITTTTDSNSIAVVVHTAGSRQPWTIARGAWDEAVATNNNSVIVKFTNATLDGVKGA